jgi:hypothetical protein
LLKVLSGKWKLQLFKLAMLSPLQLEGNNKLSLTVALKELKDAGILQKM